MRRFVFPGPLAVFPALVLIQLTLSGCDGSQPTDAIDAQGRAGCDPSRAVETDGYRRLALIVGVGQYAKFGIPDLEGPPNDARRFYELLTNKKSGYGFPTENVCMLLDEEATTARFREVFNQALVGRAREGKGDVAVFYYAGHGSQSRDTNGDEPDEWDETLLLHDARTDGVGDLVDDEFNQMLARLQKKTQNVTVILDSCNSGTATRGPGAGTTVARFFEPAEPEEAAAEAAGADGGGDGGAGWVPAELPGLVTLTAATDSNPAMETNGYGIFTNALIAVMSQVGDRPMTYAQVARQAPTLVAAESAQIPYFHGDLARPVFGNTTRMQPLGWEVKKVGPPVELSGPPLPGVDVGTEFRLYDGAATGAETRDPGKAKATVVIDEASGVNAKGHVYAATPGAAKLAPGDLAVLVRPADAFVKLTVRLRPANEPGGIPREQAERLRSQIEADPEASMLVQLTDGAGDFELSVAADGPLVLRGPQNRVRNTYAKESQVAQSLWQHARQRALLQLRGEGGADFTDNQTLMVSLVPAPPSKQSKCATGVWEPAEPNTEQVIPLCYAWNLQVKLSEKAPVPLLVGGLILSTSGDVFALPADGRKVRLQPGEAVTFDARRETFVGTPPLDVQDRVLAFGTQETNPVAWGLLAQAAQTRAARPPGGALQRALDRYLRPGTRGIGLFDEGPVEDTTWTMSTVTLRVQANQRFLQVDGKRDTPINRREYTIAHFDIRPYLPDDAGTALYKVLSKADWLAHASVEDGFSYKQHAWNKETDEENLRLGIDCSRAIWYAFTRAGLPYNRENRFLPTASMVGDDTLMRDDFASCSGDLQPGDVLVYRDDSRGDGHVVMVIDPEKRIAWGSQGWDGNPGVLPVEPDTGVEYQKIKYKADWERWDRKSMRREACWRYRRFSEERISQRGIPGTRALEDVCDASRRCGQN